MSALADRVYAALQAAPDLRVQWQRTVDGLRTEVYAADVLVWTGYDLTTERVTVVVEHFAAMPIDWPLHARVHHLAARVGYRLEAHEFDYGLRWLLRSQRTGGATGYATLDQARQALRAQLTVLRRDAQADAARRQDGRKAA